MKILYGLIILINLFNKNIFGVQDSPEAFKTLTVGAGISENSNRNSLHHFWKPARGWEGFIAMPFYLGELQIGIHYSSYNGKTDLLPDYNAFFYYLQWGNNWEFPFRLEWGGAIRLGNTQMLFKGNNHYSQKRLFSESEITTGIHSHLAYEFIPNWKVFFSGDYFMIFTRKRIKLLFIGIGIQRTFNTPGWLKKILE